MRLPLLIFISCNRNFSHTLYTRKFLDIFACWFQTPSLFLLAVWEIYDRSMNFTDVMVLFWISHPGISASPLLYIYSYIPEAKV